jgi:hypothetical protein
MNLPGFGRENGVRRCGDGVGVHAVRELGRSVDGARAGVAENAATVDFVCWRLSCTA